MSQEPPQYSALDLPRESPKASQKRLDDVVEGAIAGEITRLMSHYWTANEDTRLRAALANDWLEDLRGFPAHVVANACVEWRRGQTRRPTIADIRKLCLEQRPIGERHVALPSPLPETAAQLAARIAEHQAIGEKFGELGKMLRGEIPWPT